MKAMHPAFFYAFKVERHKWDMNRLKRLTCQAERWADIALETAANLAKAQRPQRKAQRKAMICMVQEIYGF